MPEQVKTLRFWRGHLPHWEVVDGRYFVTIRLSGCLPCVALDRLRDLVEHIPDHKDCESGLIWSRRYFALQEHYLHATQENAWLSRHGVADLVLRTARRYDETGKWRLSACTVRPNHIHLFLMPGQDGLHKTMHDFKHCTSRSANSILERVGKRFWQSEWFDHWSRSGIEDQKIREYIRDNAVTAGLVRQWHQWPWLWLRGD